MARQPAEPALRCHCGAGLQVDEVRARDSALVKRRTYVCSNGHKRNTYEIPESAWRAAQYDIKKALKGQLYHREIARRAAVAAEMRVKRLQGVPCTQLATEYGMSVHMARKYTQLPRAQLYPAAKARSNG